ncbi:hypothetical protein Tco_1003704 [Tanacetum coccineum]|uniref:Retrovirus-related Pol polyprotein from transposon TNT 1-94 n=1 Tax=Tanacetum coccineum TaxID=301880 RepID=A0ABQ5F9Q7_9ASTR
MIVMKNCLRRERKWMKNSFSLHMNKLSKFIPLKLLLKNPSYKNISLLHLIKNNLNLPKTRRLMHQTMSPHHVLKHSSPFLKESWVAVEGFAAEADNNRNTYDIAINSVMGTVQQINGARVEEKATLLKALNRVSKTLEADSILKASMQKMAKTNITTCGNITDLTEILRNDEHEFNQRLLRAVEGYIQNSTRLTEISNSLQAINFPSFQERITAIENTHVTMQADISSIKRMVTEIGGATVNCRQKKEPEVEKEPEVKNVENELESSSRLQLTYTILEVQIPQPEPETLKPDKGKGIARDTVGSPPNRIKASTKARLDPDTPAHSDKEEKLEKAAREARLSKPELIKVVHEVAKSSTENTLKRSRQQKSSRRKGLISIVYRSTNKRNFDVHKPFKFGDFGITKWDELNYIILKKKKKVVGDLMNSLSKKYESPRATLDELGIKSTLPAFVQVLSLTSGRKRKHHILGLECNRNLPEGISFVNNLVIEHPENGIFFIDVFGDEAFQRMSGIHKVDVETLLTYLVMGSNISTPANKRRFVYEDNPISRRYLEFKNSMISSPISIAFFSNSVVQDFKENSDDEKVKAKLELLEVGPSNTQPSKPFQTKNKGLVAETYDWDEEKVTSNDEDLVNVKVLMALSEDDKMAVGKSHARNDEWVNITMRKVNLLLSMDDDADLHYYLKYINVDLKFVEEHKFNLFSKYNKLAFELNMCRDELLVLKQVKLEALTFQLRNTKIIKQNHALQKQLKE